MLKQPDNQKLARGVRAGSEFPLAIQILRIRFLAVFAEAWRPASEVRPPLTDYDSVVQ